MSNNIDHNSLFNEIGLNNDDQKQSTTQAANKNSSYIKNKKRIIKLDEQNSIESQHANESTARINASPQKTNNSTIIKKKNQQSSGRAVNEPIEMIPAGHHQRFKSEYPDTKDIMMFRQKSDQVSNTDQSMAAQQLRQLISTPNQQQLELHSQEINGRQIMAMTIQLGNNQTDQIIMHEGQTPRELAQNFAIKHGLNQETQQMLRQQITNSYQQIIHQNSQQLFQQDNGIDGDENPIDDTSLSRAEVDFANDSDFQGNYDNYNTKDRNNQRNQNHADSIDSYQSKKIDGINSSPDVKWKKGNQNESSVMSHVSPQKKSKLSSNAAIATMSFLSEMKAKEKAAQPTGDDDEHPIEEDIYTHRQVNNFVDESQQEINDTSLRTQDLHNESHLSQNPRSTEPSQQLNKQPGTNDYLTNQSESKMGTIKEHRRQSTSRSKSYSSLQHAGQRLYEQGKIQQNRMKQQHMENQLIQEIRQTHGVTFKPVIVTNQNNQLRREPDIKPEDFLLYQGKLLDQKKQILRKIQEEEDMSACSFRPKILKKSARIDQQRGEKHTIVQSDEENLDLWQENQQSNIENEQTGYSTELAASKRYRGLYSEAQKRLMRQEQLKQINFDKQCTFKPHLVAKQPRSKSISKDVQDGDLTPKSQNVFNRMQQQKQSIHARSVEKMKKVKADEKVDQKSGQPLFTPKINRSSSNLRRRQQSSDVHNHLYQMHQYKEQRLQKTKDEYQQQAKYNRSQQQLTYKKAQDKSGNIQERKLKEKLGEIFQLMDIYKRGYIQSNDVCLDYLPTQICEILTPLLKELEMLNESLDHDEFVESGMSLVATLTISQKDKILKFSSKPKNQEGQSQHGFKPKILKKSKKIVEQQPLSQLPVEERLMRQKFEKDQKHENMREEQKIRQMEECRFTPVLQERTRELSKTKAQKQNAQLVQHIAQRNREIASHQALIDQPISKPKTALHSAETDKHINTQNDQELASSILQTGSFNNFVDQN